MKTYAKVIEAYGKLDVDKRKQLQIEFGNDGIANRERKFYNWLRQNKKV